MHENGNDFNPLAFMTDDASGPATPADSAQVDVGPPHDLTEPRPDSQSDLQSALQGDEGGTHDSVSPANSQTGSAPTDSAPTDNTPTETPEASPAPGPAPAPSSAPAPADSSTQGLLSNLGGLALAGGLVGGLAGGLVGVFRSAVPDVYARRRARALLVVALVATLGWLGYTHGVPGAAPSREEQIAAGKAGPTAARNAKADSAVSLVANDQAAAHAYLDQHGTLDGFQLRGRGVRFAAAGPTLVASRKLDGICYMYAVTSGANQKALVDTTGAACTDAAIAAAQDDLDTQAAELAGAAAGDAELAFSEAARIASYYSVSNWENGQPSLRGVTGLPNDVRVLANRGAYLEVSYGSNASCVKATIGADGTVGETSPC